MNQLVYLHKPVSYLLPPPIINNNLASTVLAELTGNCLDSDEYLRE